MKSEWTIHSSFEDFTRIFHRGSVNIKWVYPLLGNHFTSYGMCNFHLVNQKFLEIFSLELQQMLNINVSYKKQVFFTIYIVIINKL